MKLPSGCRIHFSILGPQGNTMIDDVLEARLANLEDGCLHIFNINGERIRCVNFAHVLVVQPLETVGPGALTNA